MCPARDCWRARRSRSPRTCRRRVQKNSERAMSRLSGRVALVTGAGQGVGQGIAYALAAEGAAVAGTGRTLAKVEGTGGGRKKRGGKAFPPVCGGKHAEIAWGFVPGTGEEDAG